MQRLRHFLVDCHCHLTFHRRVGELDMASLIRRGRPVPVVLFPLDHRFSGLAIEDTPDDDEERAEQREEGYIGTRGPVPKSGRAGYS